MGKTRFTAIDAKTISINGSPAFGSPAATGRKTRFGPTEDVDAVLLNGVVVAGTLPAGQRATRFKNVDFKSLVQSGGTPTPSTVYSVVKLATAVSDINAGVRDGMMIFAGDSVTYGVMDNVGSGTVGARSRSLPVQLAGGLLSNGYKVSCDNVFGLGGSTGSTSEQAAYYTAAAPLTGSLAIGTGWGPSAGSTLGGRMFQKTSSTAGPISFVPALPWRDAEIFIAVLVANAGGIRVTPGPGAPVDFVNSTLGTGFHRRTVDAGSEGLHTLTIDSLDANQTHVIGFICKSRTEKRLHIINTGVRGAAIGTFLDATQFYSPRTIIEALGVDAIEFSVGINDFRGGNNQGVSDLAGFITNINTLAQSVAPTGSVFIRLPNDISPTDGPGPLNYINPQVWDAYRAYATSNSFNLTNTQALFGDYAAANGRGDMADGLHPKAIFSSTVGAAESTIVRSAVSQTVIPAVQIFGSAPTAVVGADYTFQPRRVGGAGARTWAISPSAPSAITINAATGLLSGIAAGTSATIASTITATDATGMASLPVSIAAVNGAYTKFPGSVGTDVTTIPLNGGNTWSVPTGSSTWVIDANNRAYISAFTAGAFNQLLISSLALANDQFASVTLTQITPGSQGSGVALRVTAGAGYAFVYRNTTNQWEIERHTSGSWTTIGTAPFTQTWTTSGLNLRLEVRGQTLTAFVDNEQVIQITDSTYTAGNAGLATRITAVATLNTGYHYSNYQSGPLV